MTTAEIRCVAGATVVDRDRETGRLLFVAELRRRLGASLTSGRRAVAAPEVPSGLIGWGASPVPVPALGQQEFRLVDRDRHARVRGDALAGLCPTVRDAQGVYFLDRAGILSALRRPWSTAPRVMVGSLFDGPAVSHVASALADAARRWRTSVLCLRVFPTAEPDTSGTTPYKVIGWSEAREWSNHTESVEAGVVVVGQPGDPRPSLALVARLADRGRRLGCLVVIEVARGRGEIHRAMATQRPDLLVMSCGRDADEIRLTAAAVHDPHVAATDRSRVLVATLHDGRPWTPDARAALACLAESAIQPVDMRLRPRRPTRPDRRALDRILAAAVVAANSTL